MKAFENKFKYKMSNYCILTFLRHQRQIKSMKLLFKLEKYTKILLEHITYENIHTFLHE